jgi:alpha-mannosidase
VHAYLLNNYWHTNYKADQAGPLSFRFVLAPHAAFDPVALRRLSDEQDFPLLAVGADQKERALAAPLTLQGDRVLVSSLRRMDAGDALSVVLHNPGGQAASITARASSRAARISIEGAPGDGTREVRLVVPARGTRRLVLTPR